MKEWDSRRLKAGILLAKGWVKWENVLERRLVSRKRILVKLRWKMVPLVLPGIEEIVHQIYNYLLSTLR